MCGGGGGGSDTEGILTFFFPGLKFKNQDLSTNKVNFINAVDALMDTYMFCTNLCGIYKWK